jgi:hypothetical protein
VTTNAAGLAKFDTLKITGLVQHFSLQFTSAGLTSDTTSTMNLVAGAAARVDSLTPLTTVQTMGAATGLAALPKIVVTDVSGNVVPGFFPGWSLLSPCSFSFASGVSAVATDVNGQSTAPAVQFPANSAASCAYTVSVVVNAQHVTNSPMIFTEIVAPANANVWRASSGVNATKWETAANWTKNLVPSAATDTVFVPTHTITDISGFSQYPALAVNTNRGIGSLYIEQGAVVGVASDTLTVNGSLFGGNVNVNNNGLLLLSGSGGAPSVQGTFGRTAIGATGCANGVVFTLSNQVRTTDTLTVNCQVNVGTNNIDTYNLASADMQVLGNGVIDMTSPSASVVARNMTFGGASSVAHLTAGTLTVNGKFKQLSTTSATSFAPSGTHLTVLGSSFAGDDSITFASPSNAGTFGFANLKISTSSGRVTYFKSSAYVAGILTVDPSVVVASAAQTAITVAGTVTSGLASSMIGVQALTLLGNTFPTLLTMTAAASFNGAVQTQQPISVAANTLTVHNNLIVSGAGQLNLIAGSSVVVDSSLSFSGSVGSSITGGTIEVKGATLTLNETAPTPTTFGAGSLVKLTGTVAQTIVLSSVSSRFYDMSISNSAGVTFGSDATAVHQLDLNTGSTLTIGGLTSPFTFTMDSASVAKFHSGSIFSGNMSFLNASTCQRNDPAVGGTAPTLPGALSTVCTLATLP